MILEIHCGNCDLLLQTREKDEFEQSDYDDINNQILTNPCYEKPIPDDYEPIYIPCIYCNDHPNDGITIIELDD